MLNSDDETRLHAKNLEPLIRNNLYQAPFLVIGYSGQSDSVFPTIENAFTGAERLVWAGYSEEPDQQVNNLIKKGGNTAEYLGGADADLFLIDLSRALQCFPPRLFEDPHGHLLEELQPVVEFPVGANNGVDILRQLRRKLESVRNVGESDDKPDLGALMLKGDSAGVVEQGDPEDEESKDSISWAYILEGNELTDRAFKNKDEALFEAGFEKCAKAIEIKADKHEAYYNWGNALLTLGDINGEKNLFGKALEILVKSEILNKDDVYNLACGYARLGKFEECERKLRHCM